MGGGNMSSDDSVYRAPESSLERPVQGSERSLDQAIAGEFDFDIGDIMREAWGLVDGSKQVILGGFAVMIGLSLASGVVSSVAEGSDSGFMQLGSGLFSLFTTVITYPISAGIVVYTIKRAAGDTSASFDDVFAYFGKTLPLFVLSVVQGLLTMLGFLLLVLPGIYLAIAYMMGGTLLVVRDLGIWESLETSRKALTNCWFRLLGLGVLLALIVIVGGSVTLGIGLIWLVPFSWLCLGVAYRNVFGYAEATR